MLSLLLCGVLCATAPTDTTAETRLLARDSLLADIALLEQALTELHPGVYRYQTHQSAHEAFERLRAQIQENTSEADFMRMLAQTTAQVRCGHTYVNPWNLNGEVRQRLFGGEHYLPLGFRILDGRFVVTENVSEAPNLQRGAEITRINGVPVQTIYDSLKTVAKTDGHNEASVPHYLSLQNFKARHWNAFDIYFPLFFPLTDGAFTVEYRNYGATAARTVRVRALSKAARAEAVRERYGDAALDRSRWSVEVVSPELAIMRLGTFATWNWKDFDAAAWFAKAFRQLDSLDIPNLAVDIRGNGGGLSEPRDLLISYLIEEKLVCADAGEVLIRTTRLNPDLRPYVDTWSEPFVNGLPAELYEPARDDFYRLLVPSDCPDITPQPNRYRGRIFLFGDASNVSATFTLLQKANQTGFATYVGAPSGGNRQGINGGEYAFFHLPYSHLEVDIPLKYFAPTSPQPDAGVLPAVPLTVTQADIAAGRDVYLDYVRDVIAE